MSVCPSCEDVQDEGSAVYHLGVYSALQISLLGWGEFIIEDNQVVSKLLFERSQFLKFAFAQIVCGCWRCQALRYRSYHLGPCCARQLT